MARKADSAPAADNTVVDDVPKKKRGKLMLFLVPALIVGLLSGTALGVAQNDTMARVYAMMETPDADADADAADGEDADPAEEEDEDIAPEEFGAFSEMTGLIVNPAGTDGSRYLMLSVAFEGSEDVIAELGTREIVVKDRLLRHLAEQPVDRLAAFANRDSLKAELLGRANSVLQEGKISRLYFTQYVLQ